MTNEEKIIQENIGTKNPFLVPDDYFEQFAERLMEKLPDKEQQSAHQSTLTAKRSPFTVHRSKLRIFLAAACLCVAIFSIAIYFNKTQQTAEQEPVTAAAAANSIDDDYMDQAADYVMLDNADIYACLSE